MRRNRKVLKMAAWLLVMAMLMTGVPMPSTVFAGKAPKLNCKKATIKVGKTKKLKVKNAGRKKVKWSSSKKKVATVSSKGLVKGKSAGRTVIKAKVGKKVLKCGIIVKAVPEEPEETDDVDWDAWENQTDPSSRTAAPAPTAKAPVNTVKPAKPANPAKTANPEDPADPADPENSDTPEKTEEPAETTEPEKIKTAEPQSTDAGEDAKKTPEVIPEESAEPVLCAVQITTYKDGNIWSDSGKVYYLKKMGEEVFENSMEVANGTYDIYVSDGKGTEPQDTGEDVEVTGHNRKIAIHYYTVSFMDANSLMPNVPQQIVRKGQKVTCPDIIPGKIGYEFVGWEIDEEDGNDPVLYDFDREITQTTVLQVKWKAAAERTVYAAQCYYEDLDGNYPDTPSKYYENISAVTDSIVSAADYTPEGFKPDPDRNENVSVKADGNTVAVYYYKRLSYTLTWDYHGGSDGRGSYFTETVKYGQTLTVPADVKMTGCVCVGWVDEDGSPLVAGGTMPAKDITYKAVWKKESEVTPVPTPVVPSDDTSETKKPAERTPEAPAAGTEAPAERTPEAPAAGTEAPAERTPEAPAAGTEAPAERTPEAPGAGTEAPAERTPEAPAAETEAPAERTPEVPAAGTEAPATAVPIPTPVSTPARYSVNIITRKDGVVWSDAGKAYFLKKQGEKLREESLQVEDGIYEIYLKENNEDIDTGISVTVNGRDSQAYIDYYTVSFMDGTSLMQDVDRQIVLSGRCAVKPSDNPGKQGYAFAGWMLNDTDTEYDFDLAVTAATVIKAKWEASSQSTVYKKEYYLEDLDGNYPLTASDTKEGISAIAGTLVKASDSVPEGFTPDDSKNSDVSVTADGNTVARFYYKRLSYSLTWDYNGGTRNGSTYATESVKYGAALTEPSGVVYNGYRCAGWLDEQGQQFAAENTMPAGNLKYTAKWQTVEYSISYTGTEGASALAALPTGYTIESETFTIAALTRTGYTFLGWTGSNGSSPQQTVTIGKGSTGNRSYTANWKANPTPIPTVKPTAAPTVKPTVKPTATPIVKPTAAPVTTPITPVVTPEVTAKEKGETLKVGKYSVRLGMTKSTVAGIMAGVTPRMGRSPQNYESYVYNPNGDYTQLLEVQFKDGLVVEMSTISSDFSYGDQVKAGDNVSTLTANGYKANSSYKYKFYAKQTDSASVDVMTDICREGEVYGIQIFDIDLGSLNGLLMPDKCTYNDDINKYQGKLASDYLKAYRIYHKIEAEMEISDTGVAQTQAEYMAKVKSDTTSDVRGWTFGKRFEVDYGGMDEEDYDSMWGPNPSVESEDRYTKLCCKSEFASSGSPDAFSAVTYAIAISTSTSEFYEYILMEEKEALDSKGNPKKDKYGDPIFYYVSMDYELKLECGFANGYAAFDFYGPWI